LASAAREQLIGGTFFGGEPPAHVKSIVAEPDAEPDIDLTAANGEHEPAKGGWARS
jgi:hypothetical protein